MNLDDLLKEMKEKMQSRDLSDKYLEENGKITRTEMGIGEYGYGITTIPCEWVYNFLSDYKRVLKENEELKSENSRLKVIRYSTEYGTENIHLITKSDLVQIDINRYKIEIEDGKFVDLKQIYQENKKLHKEIVRMKSLDIYKLVEDWETGQLIPKQKIKDIMKYMQKEYNKLDEQVDEYINDGNKDLPKYYENKEKIGTMQTLGWFIGTLQELLEK